MAPGCGNILNHRCLTRGKIVEDKIIVSFTRDILDNSVSVSQNLKVLRGSSLQWSESLNDVRGGMMSNPTDH